MFCVTTFSKATKRYIILNYAAMKITTTILLFFLFNVCTAQSNTGSACDLQSKNTEWKASFGKAQNKAEQILLIKAKVLADSAYFDYNKEFKTHDVKYSSVDKFGNDCGCKIVFHLYSKANSLKLNVSENPRVKLIIAALNESNVNEIVPLFDGEAEKLYGTFGKCGAVVIKTTDKKLLQLIKTIN